MSELNNVFGLSYQSKDKGGHIVTSFTRKGEVLTFTDRAITDLQKMEELCGVSLSEAKLQAFLDGKVKGISALIINHAEKAELQENIMRTFVTEAASVIPDDDEAAGVNPQTAIIAMAAKVAAMLDPNGFSVDSVIKHLQSVPAEKWNKKVERIKANGKDEAGAWILSRTRES